MQIMGIMTYLIKVLLAAVRIIIILIYLIIAAALHLPLHILVTTDHLQQPSKYTQAKR